MTDLIDFQTNDAIAVIKINASKTKKIERKAA